MSLHEAGVRLRSCLGLLYVERRGSVFYRLDSILGGLLVATLGGLVQYSRDHGWEPLGHGWGVGMGMGRIQESLQE